jgi:uncharacterized protein
MSKTYINEIRILEKIKFFDKPILIAGFPGPGLVGSISTSFIIDYLNMHQIACVESDYITPGVIYIGGKLRHPFRIYANEEGSVYVMVCEAPVLINGIHIVMDTLMRWSKENKVAEVVVLDSIPLNDIPKAGRQTVILHDDGIHKERMENDKHNNRDEMNRFKENNKLDRKTIENSTNYNYTAYIGGLAGGLLSSCLSYGISCTAILIPAPTGFADPEGAALLIESFGKITNTDNLKIDPTQLKKQGIIIRQQLDKIMQSIQEQRQQLPPDQKSMYG